MIGKPEWFMRRKYSGWGLTPKTWQGWVYIAVIMVPFIIFQALPFWSLDVRLIVTGAWLLFLVADVTHIMAKMKKDERERLHEAIAERNALWVMMLVLVFGLLYQVWQSAMAQKIAIDWVLLIALFGALIAKSISNLVLDRRN